MDLQNDQKSVFGRAFSEQPEAKAKLIGELKDRVLGLEIELEGSKAQVIYDQKVQTRYGIVRYDASMGGGSFLENLAIRVSFSFELVADLRRQVTDKQKQIEQHKRIYNSTQRQIDDLENFVSTHDPDSMSVNYEGKRFSIKRHGDLPGDTMLANLAQQYARVCVALRTVQNARAAENEAFRPKVENPLCIEHLEPEDVETEIWAQ